MAKFIHGSINLSKAIDAGQVKKFTLRNGEEALFLEIAVFEKKEPKSFTNEATGKTRTFTHTVSCAPRKDQQVEGVNYYIGDLETYDDEAKPVRSNETPTSEELQVAPAVQWGDDSLPF